MYAFGNWWSYETTRQIREQIYTFITPTCKTVNVERFCVVMKLIIKCSVKPLLGYAEASVPPVSNFCSWFLSAISFCQAKLLWLWHLAIVLLSKWLTTYLNTKGILKVIWQDQWVRKPSGWWYNITLLSLSKSSGRLLSSPPQQGYLVILSSFCPQCVWVCRRD